MKSQRWTIFSWSAQADADCADIDIAKVPTKPSIRPSIGTENPIPEEMDHREIAGRVPVMNEVQFLFASESPVLVSSAPPGQTTFCFRYKMKDGAERWSRTPVGLDGRPPDLSATICESGRSSAYACKLAAAQ